jgi:hypothetical protein
MLFLVQKTALHIAAEHRHTAVVEQMLNMKFNIEARNKVC